MKAILRMIYLIEMESTYLKMKIFILEHFIMELNMEKENYIIRMEILNMKETL
jgi:hypothetical protein